MRRLAVAMIVGGLAALVAAGCTLFEDLPDRSCKRDQDCFRAQGERCDVATATCVASGAIDAPIDAAPIDAAPIDAAAIDATATAEATP